MAQLHELIAVESDVKAKCQKILEETLNTFNSKKEHFNGLMKIYTAFAADDKDLPENEVKPMVTTVAAKLKYALPSLTRCLDVILQKEGTNCIAKADIVIDDASGAAVTLAKDVPVTVLVQYEKLLVQLRGVCDAVPTADPAQKWEKDTANEDTYTANPPDRIRTKKVAKPVELAKATDKFPAQVQLVNDDVPVGTFKTTLSTGALQPIEKSKLLGRVDAVIEAVKKARAKANQATALTNKIGKDIEKYILG